MRSDHGHDRSGLSACNVGRVSNQSAGAGRIV